jgi:hypothetical protein
VLGGAPARCRPPDLCVLKCCGSRSAACRRSRGARPRIPSRRDFPTADMPCNLILPIGPTDLTRDLYDHAFVLLAFSAAAQVVGPDRVRADALELVDYVTTRPPKPRSTCSPTDSSEYEKAVTCLTKDREALHAFFDFPAEHWGPFRQTRSKAYSPQFVIERCGRAWSPPSIHPVQGITRSFRTVAFSRHSGRQNMPSAARDPLV